MGSPDHNQSNIHEFFEDREMVQMEINDGGAAEQEFASGTNTETESNEDSDKSMNDPESSQVSQSADNGTKSDGEIDSGDAEPQPQKIYQGDFESRFEESEGQWRSLELKLDNMSDTLTVMKDFFLSGSFMEKSRRSKEDVTPKKRQGGGEREKGKGNQSIDGSNLVTTIYHNVLDRVCSEAHKQVDSEIAFKVPRPHDSSSSEDRIDTSDELMEVDPEPIVNVQCITDTGAEKM